MRRLVLSLALAVALWPAAVHAQGVRELPSSEPTSTQLETRLKPKRFLVHPRVDPEAVAGDVEQGTPEIGAQERRERLLRESVPPPGRRPDLDPAVTWGIQSRNLQRALGR